MGRKKDKKKKVSGAEKTAAKTEKRASKKTKKDLAGKGEEDIESLIAQFQEQDKKRVEVVEEKCPPPSPRCNMTLTAVPDKDELLLFGGEFFNGKKTAMYNELYVYQIRKNEWLRVSTPNPPPPRCAHQAVAVSQGGGQMFVFGGEFASPTQSQFYHYKDLWRLSLKTFGWDRVKAHGGPSARSGHRMGVVKKMIFVFGGFHDNLRDYRYFNDVHVFDLESYQWTEINVVGTPPVPRSACQVAALPEAAGILVYGGYSKERVKKDVDKGHTHTDMFHLVIDKRQEEGAALKLRWQPVKQGGGQPSARCGFSWVNALHGKLLVFGGVFDEHEDEEELTSRFYDEVYTLDMATSRWHTLHLRGPQQAEKGRKRRRRKQDGDQDGDQESGSEGEEPMETNGAAEAEVGLQRLQLAADQQMDAQTPETVTYDDGIFKVSLGADDEAAEGGAGTGDEQGQVYTGPRPCGRMNALLAARGNTLFLYGGIVEQGDKEVTLADLWSLDVKKLEEWRLLREFTPEQIEWEESSSEDEGDDDDEEEDGEEGAAGGGDEDMEEEEEEDSEGDV